MVRRFAETRNESSIDPVAKSNSPQHSQDLLNDALSNATEIVQKAPKVSAVKTVLDRLIATFLILALAPLLVSIAIAIRLESPGPILFRQERHGLNRKTFAILKFRSMQFSGRVEDGTHQTTPNDARTTQVGRFLRRTSLDELPQLINVVIGDMALVGPRPHPVPLDERYESWVISYRGRYRVKPGITGWAQVHGYRGPVNSVATMRARIEYDNNYIDNWSPTLDLKILLMTIRYGFVHKNAY